MGWVGAFFAIHRGVTGERGGAGPAGGVAHGTRRRAGVVGIARRGGGQTKSRIAAASCLEHGAAGAGGGVRRATGRAGPVAGQGSTGAGGVTGAVRAARAKREDSSFRSASRPWLRPATLSSA